MSQPIEQAIDSYVTNYLAQSQVTGLAIAVVRDGELLYAKGFGMQNVATGQPVTQQTLFHLASICKTFVGTAIMQLKEAGKLYLDDPIVKHLPYFRVDDPRSDQLTIRHLLTHTSGLPHPDDAEYAYTQPQFEDDALERYVRSLATRPLVTIPLGQTSYSDIAYSVLGDLIAKVAGTSFEDYMRRHILDPLGMTQTTLMAPREADPALLATGYPRDDDGTIHPAPYPYNRIHIPSGCIASNVLEMTRYGLAHLNQGTLTGQRILSAESYAEMWQVAVRDVRAEEFEDIALGWWVSREWDEFVVQHSGADEGFVGHFGLWTESRVAIVVLCNSSWAKPWQVSADVFRLLAQDSKHKG